MNFKIHKTTKSRSMAAA